MVRDNISSYNDVNAKVLGISIDNAHVQKKFKEENDINFTLLSDFNKDVIKEYDVVHETFSLGMKEVGKRAAFVLDKEGVVRYAEVLDVPSELPNFEAINETLKSLS